MAQYGTVCLSLLDQLRLLLVLSAICKPICSIFCFNWLLSLINTVMPSCSISVVGWALNQPLTALYCIVNTDARMHCTHTKHTHTRSSVHSAKQHATKLYLTH